jgi:thiol:disulfide interchange protein DsbC
MLRRLFALSGVLLAVAAGAADGQDPALSTPAPAAHSSLTVAPPAPPPCPRTMGASTGVALAPVPPATAALIRERLGAHIGTPTSICRTPFGLYEVLIDGDLYYVDERANFLVNGNAFDLRTQENLTESRKEDVLRVDFKALPLELAVKTVRGDGSRQLVVFEDPNCPYCKRFERQMLGLPNATVYTFLYPILSRDPKAPDDSYPKSKSIWCAPDRVAAWELVMIEGQRLRPAPEACKHPLEQILDLGQKLHVSGTPTLIFADGRRAPGLIPLEKIEKMFAEAAAAPAAAPAP